MMTRTILGKATIAGIALVVAPATHVVSAASPVSPDLASAFRSVDVAEFGSGIGVPSAQIWNVPSVSLSAVDDDPLEDEIFPNPRGPEQLPDRLADLDFNLAFGPICPIPLPFMKEIVEIAEV